MFDNPSRHQPNEGNNKKGDRGINLLPKEIQKTTERVDHLGYTKEHKNKVKVDPKAFHLPSKEQFKKAQEALPKKNDSKNAKNAASRLFAWRKISAFFHPVKKVAPPAIVAVNTVAEKEPSPEPKIILEKNVIIPKNSPEPAMRLKPIAEPREEKDSFQAKEPPIEAAEDNLEVNLLPQIKKQLTDHQIIFSYGFILVISLLIIFSPYIFYRSKNKSYRADNEFFRRQLELIDLKAQDMQSQIKDYGALAYQLASLNDVLKNHVYWSQFFPTLENHTAGNVYFTALEVAENGQITVEGLALDLRSAAEELVVMKNSPLYVNTELQALSLLEPENSGDPAVSFSLSFAIPPSLIVAAEQ